MKKSSGSSARERPAAKKGASTHPSNIDYSDIAELSDEQLATMRRVGRPPHGEEPRTPISLRIDRKVLAWLKAVAAERDRPYQSLINEILERAMKRSTR